MARKSDIETSCVAIISSSICRQKQLPRPAEPHVGRLEFSSRLFGKSSRKCRRQLSVCHYRRSISDLFMTATVQYLNKFEATTYWTRYCYVLVYVSPCSISVSVPIKSLNGIERLELYSNIPPCFTFRGNISQWRCLRTQGVDRFLYCISALRQF